MHHCGGQLCRAGLLHWFTTKLSAAPSRRHSLPWAVPGQPATQRTPRQPLCSGSRIISAAMPTTTWLCNVITNVCSLQFFRSGGALQYGNSANDELARYF
jgi:hypothetical protein